MCLLIMSYVLLLGASGAFWGPGQYAMQHKQAPGARRRKCTGLERSVVADAEQAAHLKLPALKDDLDGAWRLGDGTDNLAVDPAVASRHQRAARHCGKASKGVMCCTCFCANGTPGGCRTGNCHARFSTSHEPGLLTRSWHWCRGASQCHGGAHLEVRQAHLGHHAC
jgi:hypothetical protein